MRWLGMVFGLTACGGLGVVSIGEDGSDGADSGTPSGDDDETAADTSAEDGSGYLTLAYPAAIAFTWEAGVSGCPFPVGTVSLTNDHEALDASLSLQASPVNGAPSLLFREQGKGANPTPTLTARAGAAQTLTVEVFFGCQINQTFESELTLLWELPTLEGPTEAVVPVSGEIVRP